MLCVGTYLTPESCLMNPFLLALQFLTIIPTHSLDVSDKQLAQSSLFYPVIGLLIGGFLVASSQLITPYSIFTQASLILILWVLLTGGLHLDGLADCADAWVGGFGDQQRSLDIMKDPASGPIAVVVLVLVLLLKWSLIISVLEQQNVNALLWTPLLGRLAILILMSTSHYVRLGGLGEKIIANLPSVEVKITILIGLLMSVFILNISSVIVMLLTIFIIRLLANKRLGGVTGDVYGATVELVEVSILLSLTP